MIKKLLIFIFLVHSLLNISAQTTEISGKVTEKETGSPIPYANIIFSGSFIGTTTDINGNYTLKTSKPGITLDVSAIGFKKQTVPIKIDQKNTIDFALEEEVFTLGEVKILPGENPANILIRNIIANKNLNNPRELPSWKSQIYAKTEIDLKNVSRNLANKKILADFEFIFDYLDSIGTQGKTFLPVFFTETISNYYHDKETGKDREEIIASKVSGLKKDVLSQLTGKLYEDVSIYDNYITISEVGLISPV
ncbi:MAG TPA: carboxypeptidase-like regulatory domain-containing protein, partial [Draconibacterium sp.]|nr:carboxypeptidase-like regulatory domain-containing protein [Draconibacterium sp.]